MKYYIVIFLLFALVTPNMKAQSAVNTTKYTTTDYGKAFEIVTQLGLKMDMSLETALANIKGLKASDLDMGFRSEYTYPVGQNGLKELTLYFDKENHAPLYEFILEFEDADTLEALCAKDLGPGNHPRLQEHWVMHVTPEGLSFMLWRFENKLIMASNLPDTELADDYTFQFDQAFIDAFLQKITEETTGEAPAAEHTGDVPADLFFTQTLNQYIANAPLNFEALKGDAVAGKTNEFYAVLSLGNGDQNAIIRKKDSNTWRLESKMVSNQTLDMAKKEYQDLIQKIGNLEALEYRLIKKSEYSTNTGNTYLWDAQTLDGDALGVIVKVQLYAAGSGLYSVKLEIGQ